MTITNKIWLTPAAILIFAGCAAPAFADRPFSEPAPQMTVDPNNNMSMVWANLGAFGSVPAADVARGATICSRLDTPTERYVARGYHPRALDANGAPYNGGGFNCVRS